MIYHAWTRLISVIALLAIGYSSGYSEPYPTPIPPGIRESVSTALVWPSATLPRGYDWKFNTETGHYYAITSQALSWDDANKKAESIGGFLVTINNYQENVWLYERFRILGEGIWWIGLKKVNGLWEWVTGDAPSTYFYWVSGEGNDNYLHAAMLADEKGGWDDRPNNETHYAIIEYILPPAPTPTPTPTPAGFISFDGIDLTENQLVANAPAGFTLGKISFGEIPTSNQINGPGMSIRLAPGQGALVVSNQQFDAEVLSHISGVYKASSSDLTVALVALNSPIDGQLGYTNIAGDEVPIEDYRQLNLYYAPPSGKVQLGVQVINSPYASITSTLWVDSLKVVPYGPIKPIAYSEEIITQVEGNFEGGLAKLITNFNDMDGVITPFFETLTDIAIRLSISPDQTAANIGTLIEGIENKFPLALLGEVSVYRDSAPGGGTLGFVMTNGYQNTALFRRVDELPGMQSISQEHLIIGSDFTVNNPNTPIHVVIQNGGPNAQSSVVIDDLVILRQ